MVKRFERQPEPLEPEIYAQLNPCLASGSERIALAGRREDRVAERGGTGGSAGSPRPVGGLSVLDVVHLDDRGHLPHPEQRVLLKLLWTTRPLSIVISWRIASAKPSITDPCTCLTALLGLMIWLPTSPATHTLSPCTRLCARRAPAPLRRNSRGG